MALKIEYGNLHHAGVDYVGITSLIRSIGVTKELLRWEIDKAVTRYERERSRLEKGEIDQNEFRQQTTTNQLMGAAKEEKIKSSKEGIKKHSMLEAFAHGDQESLEGYKVSHPEQFKALDTWLVENDAEILQSEFHAVSEQIFVHGRSDAYIKTKRGRGVYDLKSKDKIYLEPKLQVCFYACADFALSQEEERLDYEPDYAAILSLKEKGNISEFVVSNHESYFEVLRLYRLLFDAKRNLK